MKINDLRVGILEFAFLFELFLVSLEVLDHEIFPGEFIVVSKMIDLLMRLQVKVVEYLVYAVSLDPQQVPVLAIHNYS